MARRFLSYWGTVALSFAILFVFGKLAVYKFEPGGSFLIPQSKPATVPATHPPSAARVPEIQSPRETPKVSAPSLVRRAQLLLSNLGYDPGPADGVPGNKTRIAVDKFQQDRGLVEDETINQQLIAALQTTPLRIRARGLGIGRASLQGLFESPEIGFKFEHSPPTGGRARVTGTSKNGMARLELIGPPNDLSITTMTIGTPGDAPAAVAENAFYMMGFVKHVFPEWAGATTWVISNLEGAADSGEIKKVHGSKQISISVAQGLERISITIKGVR